MTLNRYAKDEEIERLRKQRFAIFREGWFRATADRQRFLRGDAALEEIFQQVLKELQ